MKNQNYRSKLIGLFSIAIAFAFFISSTPEANAQRYLTEVKSTAELKGLAQFSRDLAEFLKILDAIESAKSPSPIEVKKLELAGRKVKNGASGFRNNLKGLISKLKNQNRWDDNLDKEINDLLGKRNVKGFFQQNVGRQLLTRGETEANSIGIDVDKIINNINQSQSMNLSENGLFIKTSFAPSSTMAKKFGFVKCLVIGVGILATDIAGADEVAKELIKSFKKNCGSGATPTT